MKKLSLLLLGLLIAAAPMSYGCGFFCELHRGLSTIGSGIQRGLDSLGNKGNKSNICSKETYNAMIDNAQLCLNQKANKNCMATYCNMMSSGTLGAQYCTNSTYDATQLFNALLGMEEQAFMDSMIDCQ